MSLTHLSLLETASRYPECQTEARMRREVPRCRTVRSMDGGDPMPHRRTGPLMRVVITLMAGLLLLAGCAPARTAPSTQTDPSVNTPVAGGRLVVGAIADAKVLNPVLSSDVPSAEVWSRVYESLIKVDA